MSASQRVAHAVLHAAKVQAGRALPVRVGTLIDKSPMRIDLLNSPVVLGDDDFDLSAWVDLYDSEWGLAVGDTLLLLHHAGDWIVFDVLPDDTPKLSASDSVKAKLDSLSARVKALEDG